MRDSPIREMITMLIFLSFLSRLQVGEIGDELYPSILYHISHVYGFTMHAYL